MLRVILTSILVGIVSQLMASNEKNLFTKSFSGFFYNSLCVFCFYSLLNIFLWNYEVNFLVTISFFYVLSVVIFYVHEFRGTNLTFSDLASIKTAKNVAFGYKYEFKPLFFVIFLFIIFEYILHIKLLTINLTENYHQVINNVESYNIDLYRFFWHEIAHFLAFFIAFFVIKDKVSSKNYDYSLYAGDKEGYIYNFYSSMPIFHKSEYNKLETIVFVNNFLKNLYLSISNSEDTINYKRIQIMKTKYKNYAKKNDAPSIIVIMNESFGSVHRKIRVAERVTPYFDSLEGVTKGNLYVNTFGGGTANTEFEFLTGATIGNYQYPIMPYNKFVKKDKYSLARYFKNLGYETIAMHPNHGSNYRRNKVYKHFGFNQQIYLKNFINKKYVRNFISDECMYNEIINKYESCKYLEQKMFLFGITMQNHSGYYNLKNKNSFTYFNYYKNREVLDSYLTLLSISDRAIKTLIDYFDNVKEKVIILFFGDHNPSFGSILNSQFYDDITNEKLSNAYRTPFFIYDNHNRFNKTIKSVSANFLSLELLKSANLPFDVIHHLMDSIYKDYSVYNYFNAKNRLTGELTSIEDNSLLKLQKGYIN